MWMTRPTNRTFASMLVEMAQYRNLEGGHTVLRADSKDGAKGLLWKFLVASHACGKESGSHSHTRVRKDTSTAYVVHFQFCGDAYTV